MSRTCRMSMSMKRVILSPKMLILNLQESSLLEEEGSYIRCVPNLVLRYFLIFQNIVLRLI